MILADFNASKFAGVNFKRCKSVQYESLGGNITGIFFTEGIMFPKKGCSITR